MKIFNRILALMLCLVTAVSFLGMEAFGATETDQSVSLTLYHRDGDKAVIGENFQIYLVATLDAAGKLNLTDPFQGLPAQLDLEDPEQWQTAAATLEGYVLRDKIAPADRGTTDQNGVLVFPTGNNILVQGLYLVLGQSHTQEGTYYEATPFLVTLPSQDPNGGQLNYSVGANVKFESDQISEEPEYVTRKVLKVWNDDGYESQRPKEIVVQLLRDGQVYQSVTLNQKNNWRHTWEKLEKGHRWTLVEKDLSGYQTTVERAGITFLVTNTPEKESPASPSSSTTSTSPSKPSTSGGSSLPKTGQLWWPVPLLICGGLGFILAGLLRRRSGTHEA